MSKPDIEYVDRTPEGDRQQASQTFSGEVFTEYGIVDLQANFPSQQYEWTPENPDRETVDEAGVDPEAVGRYEVEITERHVVVPFRVVKRGLKDYRSAKRVADAMNEENGRERYKAVLLTDPRGL